MGRRSDNIYRSGNKLYCVLHGQLRFSAYSRGAYCEACRRADMAVYQKALRDQQRSGRGIRRR